MRKLLTAVALFAATVAMAQDGAKRKITLWSFAPNNLEEYQRRKADLEKKFNVELDLQQVAQNAFIQKLQAVMMEGKGAPDIIEWMIENNRILNADPNKSFVIPLDEYVAKSEDFKKVVPGRVAWVKYGSHVYGLPHDVHPVILIYNDTLWKSVGVDVAKLKTWDDFFEASKKLTKEKKDGKPVHYALPYGNDGLNNTMFMIWQQTGAQILDEKGVPTFTSPDFKAFLAKWLEWQKTGAFTMWDWGNFKGLLQNGTLASYCSPDWWVPQVNLAATGYDDAASALGGKSTAKKAEVKYKFKARVMPAYKKGGAQAASWGGTFMAIPKGTKDPDVVYKVMENLEYDPDALLKERWATGMLPPFSSIWDNAAFKKSDPRFGGQKLGELQVSVAKVLPKVNTGDVFWQAINDFTEQYTELANGKISIDEALSKTQDKVMAEYEKLQK